MTSIAQFNCGNASADRTPADLSRINSDGRTPVDFLDLNESFDREKQIARWAHVAGYDKVPFQQGFGDTPIWFHVDRARLLDFDSHVVNPHPIYVGGKGNGPSTIHPKFVTHAKFWLVHERRVLHLLHNHLLASWTRGDLPPEEQRKRRDLAELHVQTILGVVDQIKHDSPHVTIAATGDFNGEVHEKIMQPLTEVFNFGHTGPTEGGRTIDLVGVAGDHVKAVGWTVVQGTSSDHNAVRASVLLAPHGSHRR
jgi:hypothetical protein